MAEIAASCDIRRKITQGFTIAFASGHHLSIFTSSTERRTEKLGSCHLEALDLEHFDRCDSDPLLEAD